ncbi:MATE family efflux transporter [Saxibacter everestensis]|uniref:MATE family efflux transporter n=1 Tax=Saxibacter everestensis TaxID=2909229 RepID=A0ABY8QYA8_9MICO|nr:MATE family efflux transporter [Brevibacteriaceae bacterium ZFBP1038]
MSAAPASQRRSLDRDIFRLALPALGALIAEPLFLLTDTALVGHLGESKLGGLAIASAILQTVLGLLVFLAYATTPTVARRLGSGDKPGAISAGIDGLWLAATIGAILLVVGWFSAEPVIGLFQPGTPVADAALTYLRISLWGIPAMLIVIAATGLLRGLQDTRTPLLVAGIGFAANAALNATFIYGFGWGLAGSAAGTVVVQWGMAAVYLVIAGRAARDTGARLSPHLGGVWSAAAAGSWLLVRNASLRVAMLVTVYAGTSFGVSQLAALQVALTIFATLALALDALAIAGQAMIGHGLGAADVARVKAVTRRLIWWGVVGGAGLALLVAAVSPFVGYVFTSDPGVISGIGLTVLLMAIGVPLAGYVFVLDGVLIGAGDARYLAIAGLISVAAYLPMVAGVVAWTPGGNASLGWLWLCFGLGYIGVRALTLGLRAKGSRWIVTGH